MKWCVNFVTIKLNSIGILEMGTNFIVPLSVLRRTQKPKERERKLI
jgi:hypothetical protein